MKKKTANLIDILLIFILLLTVAVTVYRSVSIKQLPDTVKNQKIEYTLLIENLDTAFADSIHIGDKLYLSDNAIFCGEVTSMQKSFVRKNVVSNAQIHSHIYPAACDITLKVRLSADISENGFYVGDNTYLNIGKRAELYTSDMAFEALLTAVEHKEG